MGDRKPDMIGTDVLKVGLDNVQALLQKIDNNQEKLFDTQNAHSKELERLNGLIEKNISTTQLEIKAIAEQSNRVSKEVTELEEKLITTEEKLEEKLEKLEVKVDKNSSFREQMVGFSWIRHGIPSIMLIIAIITLVIALGGAGTP